MLAAAGADEENFHAGPGRSARVRGAEYWFGAAHVTAIDSNVGGAPAPPLRGPGPYFRFIASLKASPARRRLAANESTA